MMRGKFMKTIELYLGNIHQWVSRIAVLSGRGVADATAGRMKDLAEVDGQIREKLGFPKRGK